jgi:hypothetical protein
MAFASSRKFFTDPDERNGMSSEKIVKIEFYVPARESEAIRRALGEAGLGRIGRYDHCAAETRVTGHWRPLEGAHPYSGSMGEIASADEMKVEFVCRADRADEAVKLIRRLHPYEEPLIMVIPLFNDSVEGSTTDVG